ncbi:MAG: STAS domain-containing protein [Limisphaerales bacterium]
MELQILEHGDTLTRVALAGRLDSAGVGQVELKFSAATATRRKDTIVDLSGVTFLSSLGIRMLLTVARTLHRAEARMILLAPPEAVLESIRHAALDQLIPVAADRAAAQELLGR